MKVVDAISRLPGCAGEASDAVSAHTQVKMELLPKLLRFSEFECSLIWVRPPRSRCPKS